MVQTSRYWSDDAVGDGVLSPYDNDEFSDIWRILFQRDRTLQGPIEGYLNELGVTNPSGLIIRVATGGALVDGKYYDNDTNVDNAILAPAALTRIDRVILRKSWALQTVRVAILTGIEGGGVPGLTQTEGVIWEIPLAQVSITVVPTITITSEFEFSRTPLAEATAGSLIHLETLIADGTSTQLDFQNISQIYRHLFLIGQLRLLGAVIDADVDVRFNNDGGANYNEQDLVGANVTASATPAAGQTEANVGTFPGATGIANHIGQLQMHIANYNGVVFFKTAIAQFVSIPNNTVADFDTGQVGIVWRDTAAISRITLISSSGNFITGSSMSLYGIA